MVTTSWSRIDVDTTLCDRKDGSQRENPCLGLRPGQVQFKLLRHRDWPEYYNFAYKKLICSHFWVLLFISPAREKDKKRTIARPTLAGCMSIRDVIIMLNLYHHAAFSKIRNFWKPFFMFFQLKNEVFSGEQER